MADPLVTLVVEGVTRGSLTLVGADYTKAWKAGLHLRLRRIEQGLRAQQLDAEIASLVANPEAHAELLSILDRRSKLILSPARTGDSDLDLRARWYILNAPGRLKALGVDLGHHESVLAR